jgi:hypothetical protein
MNHKLVIRRIVKTTEALSLDDAKRLIVEARVNLPGFIDAYEKSINQGYISRIFTIPMPALWQGQQPREDVLLEYVRNNIPYDITFGAS